MVGSGRSREAGAATTAIVIVVSVLLLALAFLYTQRVGKAEDQSSTLQAGADAAALAGAYRAIETSPDWLTDLLNGDPLPAGGTGQGAASDFASRNGGALVSYRFEAATGRIEVRVRSQRVLESGTRGQAVATAGIGKRLAACVLPIRPTSSGTPTSNVEASSTKSRSSTGIATCGEVRVPVTVDLATAKATISISDAEVRALFTASLLG